MSPRSGRPGRVVERALAVVLRLYPRDFRRRLGADMQATFGERADRVERAGGSAAAWRFVLRTLALTLVAAVPAHRERIGSPESLADAALQDARFAIRSLRRSPGFVAVAVLSLALGVGANTAIFTVVNAVLLRPLPYEAPERLMVLWEANQELGIDRYGPSGANFRDWRERSRAFESMMLFQPGSATITDLPEPEQVPGMRVTTNFLEVLGYTPALGRDFLPEESGGGRRNVVILSYGFWQRAYGGDPGIVGRELMGDHIPYTVIGVLPAEFWYPLRVDLLVPWDEQELFEQDRDDREYAAIGRLADGVTLAEARSEMDRIAGELEGEYPEQEGWTIRVTPISEESAAYLRPALLVLLSAVGFVLLIACANVANLLLARGTGRQREMAVRAATGASRGRLVLQLLIESAVLAALAGAAGWFVGAGGLQVLRAQLPSEVPLPGGVASIQVPAIELDATVFGFTLLVSLLAGIAFGLAPAWQLSVVDLAGALRGNERSTASGGHGPRLRRALVTGEIALAVVLLVGTALMIESFWNLSRVDLGFDPSGVLTMQIELPTDSRYTTHAERAQFYRELLPELAAIPGVETVGLSEVLPLDTATRRLSIRLDDTANADRELGAHYNLTTAGYFEALRVPLVRGRWFEPEDDVDGARVAIVDTTFADTYYPGEDPIGRQVGAWDAGWRIIGVVGAVRSTSIDARPEPMLYVHGLQVVDNLMSVTLRTGADPAGVTRAAKQAVWKIDPEQPVFNVRTMEAVVASRSSSSRLTLVLLAVFALVAAAMAALGVYGVMAYAVGERTHEIGIRQALGADRRRLVAMVMGEAGRLVVAGVLLGTLGSLALGRGMAALLYQVTPTQPLAHAAVAATIALVALLATWLPARRAARVDPVEALRAG